MSRVKDWQVVAEVANHGSNSPLYDRFDSAFKNLSSKENPSLVERQSLKRAGHSLYTKDMLGKRKDTSKGVEQIASIAKDKKEYPVTAYDDSTSHPNLVEKLSEFDRNVEIDKAERVHDKIMEESLIKETLRALKEKAHYEDAMFDSIAPQPQRRNPMEEGYPHGFQYFAEEEYDRSGYQRPPSTHDPVTSLPYDGQEGSYAGYKPSFNYFPEGTYDASGYQRPAPATHDPVTGLPYPDEKRVAPTGERRTIPTQEQYFDFANPEPSPINTPVVDQIHSLKKPEPELYASTNPYISSPVQQQAQSDVDRADQQRQVSDYYLQEQPMSFNRSGLLSSDDANRATYEMEHFAPGVGGYSLWNRDSNGNLYRDPNGGNCTSWAYARAIALGADPNNLVTGANARDWISRAQNMGVEVGSTPAVGATVAWPADNGYWGKLGHVGIVENVHPDGSFDMSHSGATIVARRGVRAAVDTIHYDPGTQSFYVEDGRGNHRLLNTSFIYFP